MIWALPGGVQGPREMSNRDKEGRCLRNGLDCTEKQRDFKKMVDEWLCLRKGAVRLAVVNKVM